MSSSESHKRAVNKYRKKHSELGLCELCPRPAVAGRILCEKHASTKRIRDRENSIKYRIIRAENRLCSKCATPLIEGETTRCVNCRVDDMIRRVG